MRAHTRQTAGRKAGPLPGSIHVLIFPLDVDSDWLVDPLLLRGQGVDFVGLAIVLCSRCSHVCLGEGGGSGVQWLE